MRVIVRALPIKSLGCPGRGFVVEYRRNEEIGAKEFAEIGIFPSVKPHIAPWQGTIIGTWEGGGPTQCGPNRKFVPRIFDTRTEAEEAAIFAADEDNLPFWEYRVRDARDLCLVQDQDKGVIYAVEKMQEERLR